MTSTSSTRARSVQGWLGASGFVAFAALVADQVSKAWCLLHYRVLSACSNDPIDRAVFSRLLSLGRSSSQGSGLGPWVDVRVTFVANRGLTFGWLDGSPSIALAFVFHGLTGIVLWALWHWRKTWLRTCVGRYGGWLVMAGVLGNAADRIRFGYVIDWLDVRVGWGPWRQSVPTFNLADWWIVFGLAALAWGWRMRRLREGGFSSTKIQKS